MVYTANELCRTAATTAKCADSHDGDADQETVIGGNNGRPI